MPVLQESAGGEMNGVIWPDNSHTPMAVKVQQAADYYERRYGHRPTLCWVHPSVVGFVPTIPGLTICPRFTILPGHVWIGMADKGEAE
jgi:hypothetical protein